MAKIIEFPYERQENLNAVLVLLGVVRKMHDEDGYRFTSSELKREGNSRAVLTLVLEKTTPDDLPDITA